MLKRASPDIDFQTNREIVEQYIAGASQLQKQKGRPLKVTGRKYFAKGRDTMSHIASLQRMDSRKMCATPTTARQFTRSQPNRTALTNPETH
jgi:hypothetical protein